MQVQLAVKGELEKLSKLDESQRRVYATIKKLSEDVLTLKCPRPDCRQAYVDFDGCAALTCSRCPCKFCGWCLEDCGDGDAHPHVRACKIKPAGVDAYYPNPPEKWDQHWRGRKSKGVAAVLEALPAAEQAEVRQKLKLQLAEIGM
jgi:hypothetical protein